MKSLVFASIFVLSIILSLPAYAEGPVNLSGSREEVCRQGLVEQKTQLNAKIQLTPDEENDVVKICQNSNSVYWFSQAMYIQARNAGDDHKTALNEFHLFNDKPDLVFTIPDYVYFRVVLHNVNLPYLLRAQAFRDVLDIRRKYRNYQY